MSDQLEVQSSKRVLLNDVGNYVGKRVRVVGKVQNSVEGRFTLVATDGVTSVTIIIPEHTIDPEVMPIVEVAGLVGDELSVSAELVCPFIDFGLFFISLFFFFFLPLCFVSLLFFFHFISFTTHQHTQTWACMRLRWSR